MSVQDFSSMIRDDPNNHFSNSEDLLNKFKDICYNKIKPKIPILFSNIPTAKLE